MNNREDISQQPILDHNLNSATTIQDAIETENSVNNEEIISLPLPSTESDLEKILNPFALDLISTCVQNLQEEINSRNENKNKILSFILPTDTNIKDSKLKPLNRLKNKIENREGGWLDKIRKLRGLDTPLSDFNHILKHEKIARKRAAIEKTIFPGRFFNFKFRRSRTALTLDKILEQANYLERNLNEVDQSSVAHKR